jgi:hypothetical protein
LFLSQHWNPAVVHQAVGRAVRIGQRGVVDVVMYRVVDDVMDNLDRLMVDRHLAKIEIARDVCPSLYDGWDPAPLPDPDEEDEDDRADKAEGVAAPVLLPAEDERSEATEDPS